MQSSDFRGGVTTAKRVAPGERAVMQQIDGYLTRERTMKDAGGITKVSANALTLPSVGQSPILFGLDGNTWVVTTDSTGKLRWIKADLSAQSWSAADADLAASMPSTSRMARAGKQVLVPTTGGIKRFQPGITSLRTLPLGIMDASDMAWSVSYTAPPTSYTDTAITGCEKICANQDNTTTDAWRSLWDSHGLKWIVGSNPTPVEGSGCVKFQVGEGAQLNKTLFNLLMAASHDATSDTVLTFWLYIDTDPNDEISHLSIGLYNNATDPAWGDGSLAPDMSYPLPSGLAHGKWHAVTVDISSDITGMTTIQQVCIRVESTFSNPGANLVFAIDDVRIQTAEHHNTWPSSAARYFYYPCYAIEPGDMNDRWIISNPALPVSTGDEVPQDGTVEVEVDSGSAKSDYEATHVLLYRRAENATYAELVARLPISSDDETLSFTDHGPVTVEFDERLYLHQYLLLTHDPPPTARHLLYADDRVYAACLTWDAVNSKWTRPRDMVASTRFKPWAFPSEITELSEYGDGREWFEVGRDGSEITGFGTHRGSKLIFLDNEFYQLLGESIATWDLRRVDSVGAVSERLITDCVSVTIWRAADGFCSWSGGLAENISRGKLDESLIALKDGSGDWLAHDSAYWDGRYVAYCLYDSVPSLLIYDIDDRSWVVHSVPALAGLVADRANRKLYGVNTAGWLVELFSGAQVWTNDGEYVDRELTAWTREWGVGTEVRVCGVVIDLEAQADETIDVTLQTKGQLAESQTVEVSLDTDRTRYVVNFSATGNAASVKIEYTGQTPPEIMGIRLIGPSGPEVTA